MTQLYTKEELKTLLREGLWDIDFIKVDGSLTSMTCTLAPELLPAVPANSEPAPKLPNEEVLRVYSTDRKGWRSFKIANLQKITKV